MAIIDVLLNIGILILLILNAPLLIQNIKKLRHVEKCLKILAKENNEATK